MIRYKLRCPKSHEFEAWFSSSSAYDRQAKRGQVSCPQCGATKIAKAPMAPNISARTKGRVPADPHAPAVPDGASVARRQRVAVSKEMTELMRQIRKEVEAKADYVGPRFAEEARKIHHEEVPARGIYGEATAREVQELAEEGVEVLPLPTLPEDYN